MTRPLLLCLIILLLSAGVQGFRLPHASGSPLNHKGLSSWRNTIPTGGEEPLPKSPPTAGLAQRIWIAAGEGDIATLRLLLQEAQGRPEMLNWQDEYGYTPLCVGCFYGRVDVVRLLTSTQGVELNRGDNGGMTPLHAACFFGRLEVVAVLLDVPGIVEKVNVVDNYGFSACHYAAREGYADIVQALSAVPVTDLNLRDTEVGWTALMVGVFNCRIEVVRVLQYEEKCDVQARANRGGWSEGMNAQDLAMREGYVDIADMLRATKRG